ncbi:MAG: hypothetical protein EON59_03160 [Alphaproteobacteria bacterium]|nr:MAG: hypothetical protein EON59_03160 [Alphaproteobacteria bacterium]
MTLVISNCSKRKRLPVDSSLQARDLPTGTTRAVASAWATRISAAAVTSRADDLYGGRAFSEARRAARESGGELAIVSAGLGLIDGHASVPAYSLTTAPKDVDNVLSKTAEMATDWWDALERLSPFQSQALETEEGLILAALPASYLAMVADAWAQWPAERLARLRLFSKERPDILPTALRDAWMPYDDRLDAVAVDLQGTQTDFAQRAVRHFVTEIGGSASAKQDHDEVRAALEGLAARVVPVRIRSTDAEIVATIEAHWEDVNGRSNAMLRRLRDDLGLACEQSRFKGLFRTVADRRGRGSLQ